MRIKYIGWFFDFIWQSLKDMLHPIDCIKSKLIQENWGDFIVRIKFYEDPRIKELMKELHDIDKCKRQKNK